MTAHFLGENETKQFPGTFCVYLIYKFDTILDFLFSPLKKKMFVIKKKKKLED